MKPLLQAVNKGIIMVNFYAAFVAADPKKATIDTIVGTYSYKKKIMVVKRKL